MFEILFSEEGGNDSDHEGIDKVQNAYSFGGLVFFHLLFEDVSGALGLFSVEETGGLFTFLHREFESWVNNYRLNRYWGYKKLLIKQFIENNFISSQMTDRTNRKTTSSKIYQYDDWICLMCQNLNYSFRKTCTWLPNSGNRCRLQTK